MVDVARNKGYSGGDFTSRAESKLFLYHQQTLYIYTFTLIPFVSQCALYFINLPCEFVSGQIQFGSCLQYVVAFFCA